MAQGILKYEYEIEEGKSGLTTFSGLPPYIDLAAAAGFLNSIDRHLEIRAGEQGWTDRQIVLSLVLLNIAGGDCVDDIEKLEGDEGFCRIFRKAEGYGMKRKDRRELQKRWRKERKRTFPSASVIFRYLSKFHDEEQEKLRTAGKAFIPAANEHLKMLRRINGELIGFEKVKPSETTATLDMDATSSAAFKEKALYSYKGGKG